MTLCIDCTRQAGRYSRRCKKCQRDEVLRLAGWDEKEAAHQVDKALGELRRGRWNRAKIIKEGLE